MIFKSLFAIFEQTESPMFNYLSAFKSLCLVVGCGLSLSAQEVVFSGPQIGESIVPFEVRMLLGPDAGKTSDFVTKAKGSPLLMVFLHDVNRQSISMVRTLTTYSAKRVGDGLQSGVILLSDDAEEAEKNFHRMKHAFHADTSTGISLDGREGPGSYGLNRLVTLTVLLTKDNKVIANYALVQPSLQADLPKVVKSITDLIGGPTPTMEELVGKEAMRNMQSENKASNAAPDVSGLVRPLIQKNASSEHVTQLAEKIEDAMKKDEAVRREIYRISTAVTGGGKLTDYGTPKAQEYLLKWAKENQEAKEKSSAAPRPAKDSKP